MNNFITNLKKRHNDNNAFTHSIQTGYFLMLSLFLLIVVTIMLGTNIGYDSIKTSAQDKAAEFKTEHSLEDNPLLSKIINSEKVSKYIESASSALVEYEKQLEHSIKFSNIQIFVFIAFFLLVLIIAPSKFKVSLNASEENHKSNIILNIIGKILTSLLLTMLLLENILIQFLNISTFEKWSIQIIVNMILLIFIYHLMISGKRPHKRIFLASFISSIAISLAFFVTLGLALLIANGSVIVAAVTYSILFMSSLIIIVYTIIISKELASSLLSK